MEIWIIKIKENNILKKNKCKFKYLSGDSEDGELILYCNRIVWNGFLNNFTIPIANITDISVKNIAAKATLFISINNEVYTFSFINNAVLSSAALAALGGLSEVAIVGVAMMNDKPITDIEFWRQKIECLREIEKKSPNTFGISHEKITIKVRHDMKILIGIVITIILAGFIGYIVWLSNLFNY